MVNAGAMVGEVLDTAMGVTLEYVLPYDIAYFFPVSTAGARCCSMYLESVANGELQYRVDARLQYDHEDWQDVVTDHCIKINGDTRLLDNHGAQETAAYIVRQLHGDVAGDAIQSPEVAALVCRTLVSLDGQGLRFVPDMEGDSYVAGENDHWTIGIYERGLLDKREALRKIPAVMYPEHHWDCGVCIFENLRLNSWSLWRLLLETWALLLLTCDPVEYMFCQYTVHRENIYYHGRRKYNYRFSRRILKFRLRSGSYHLVERVSRDSSWYVNDVSPSPGSSVSASLAYAESGEESENSLVDGFPYGG